MKYFPPHITPANFYQLLHFDGPLGLSFRAKGQLTINTDVLEYNNNINSIIVESQGEWLAEAQSYA